MARKPLSRVDSQETDADPEHNVTPSRRPIVTLVGTDGNAFAVLGACQRAAKKAGWTAEQWTQVREEMTQGSYDHLLGVAMQRFDVQ